MKKIDLHIHTIASISDYNFTFSIEKLKEYITSLGIDCIAITNHNLFDLEQFQKIADALEIPILPGIEINVENGHLLLISDNNELEDFQNKCYKVTNLINTPEDDISVDKLKEIYVDLKRYLLIPHYDKKPVLSAETLAKLADHITAGEVASAKKFKYCVNDQSSLVPVLFSDLRISDDISGFSPRQTFIDIDNISLRSIKSCLSDKAKVLLSQKEGHRFFQVFENGQVLSNGLNVILGERSSGKTFTLKRIYESYENVKYIKQFELLEKEEEQDIQKFNKLLSIRQSSISETYLQEFKAVVEDVTKINRKENEIELQQYLESLLKVATEEEKRDAFSNAFLFNETKFSESDDSNLKKLINSVELLIENTEYRDIIDSHIPKENLMKLILNLMQKYNVVQETNLKKRWVNSIVINIKSELQSFTASSSIKDIDFYKMVIEKEKLKKFETIVNLLKKERTIESTEVRRFKIIADTRKFTGANELLKKSGRKMVFSEAYPHYNNPVEYLESLKSIQLLEEVEYYKYFVNIEYKILNEYDTELSGGERSEFNLLQNIKDAYQYDMLLIDEPESSFDNLFLKSEVNELIKEIAKSLPVVVVTHNNTVGASIKPDYVLYTKKDIIDKRPVYKVFSGYPSDLELKSISGESISNFNIMLNCLEAGNEAYKERGKSYEILKN